MDISIIIPAYNEAKCIRKALESIKAQKTNLKHEIIVSDSYSTDDTVKISKKYTNKIVTDNKKGIARARNNGAAIAKGNILVFIDADTEILPDYLETIFQRFKKHPSLVAVSCAFRFSKQTPALIFAEEITNDYLIMRSRLKMATLPGFNTAVLAEKFKKIGGYKEVLLEDVKLSRDLELIGRTEYLSNKKVITSSRKLEQMGLLGTLRYYFELDLLENNIGITAKNFNLPLKTLNRIKNRILQKAIKNKHYKYIR